MMKTKRCFPRPFYGVCVAGIFTFVCLVALTSRAQAAGLPTISSFSPDEGSVGSTVTILGTNFDSPIAVTFGGNAAAAGSFTTDEITITVPYGAQTGPIEITTSGGTVLTKTDFTIGDTPVATLDATVPTVIVGSGKDGEFTVRLSAARTVDTVVNYTVKGNAIDGTDYALVADKVTIKAGRTSKVIKIAPKGHLDGATEKTVKLHLTDGHGYTIGTKTAVLVKIIVSR